VTDPPKVLIADDESRMRDSLRLLLADEGFDIDMAGSGAEAMARLDKQQYDLLLLDMHLGDMDGFAVMEHIRSLGADTLVVIITGDASIESAVSALKRGAYDYLKKPFEPEDLINTANKALDFRRLESDRRRVARKLSESEKRFQDLVESSLIGLCIIQNGRVVYQNPEQKKLFQPFPEIFNIGEFEFVHPDDRPRLQSAYQRLCDGQSRIEEINFRFFPPGKMGSKSELRWVQCRACSFRYQGQSAILLNMMDQTRTRELEHLVTIKDKMLSLGRIAAGIAHEIRNPLTGINSHLYNLEDLAQAEFIEGQDLELMQNIIRQLQSASNKIEAVIKRVLDFSKPSMPRMMMVDLNQSLLAAAELSGVSLRKSGIQLETEMEPDLPKCYVDPHMVEQVLLNLITNAAQMLAKLDGEKIISLISHSNDQHIQLCVADSGQGVPPELREQIFDPFFTTKVDGSGIGLSIVQRIVADHNGIIEVGASKYGGAEFRIQIPVEKRNRPR
jgi:PAS domain S-box-containing protein